MSAANPMKPPGFGGGNAFNPLGAPTPGFGGGHTRQPMNGLGGGGGGLMNVRGYGGPNFSAPPSAGTAQSPGFSPPSGMGGSGFLTDSQAGGSPAGQNLAAAFMHGMAPVNPMSFGGPQQQGTPQFPMGPFNAGDPQQMPQVGGMPSPGGVGWQGGAGGQPLPGSAPPPMPMGRMQGQMPTPGVANQMNNPLFRTQ